MRGIIISQLAAVVLVIAALGVFVLMVSEPARAQVSRFVTGGTCGNGVCDSEFERTYCKDDCPITKEPQFSFEHLLINVSNEDVLSKADALAYLKSTDYYVRSNGAWAGTETSAMCSGCSKCSAYLDFISGKTCSDCEECELNKTTNEWGCGDCFRCDEAKSSTDTNTYKDCLDCTNCTACTMPAQENGVTPPESLANCTKCGFCSGCIDAKVAEASLTYPVCGQCAWCENAFTGVGTGGGSVCHSCGDCNATISSEYWSNPDKFLEPKRCWNCDRCLTGAWAEPAICERLRECIADFDGTPCELEPFLSVKEKITRSEMKDVLKEALLHCHAADVMKQLPEGAMQKVCLFNASTDLLLISTTNTESNPIGYPESEQYLTFSECGAKGIYTEGDYTHKGEWPFGIFNSYSSSNPLVPGLFINTYGFTSATQPAGWHYKITVGAVNYSVDGDNVCRYNIFVCAVRPQANDTDDKNQILNVHSAIVKTLLNVGGTTTDEETTKPEWFKFTVPAVTIEQNKCTEGKNCDVYQYDNIIMTAMNDWQASIRTDRDTIDFFCKGTANDANYDCSVVPQIIMDGTRPWSASSGGIPSSVPDSYPSASYPTGPNSKDILSLSGMPVFGRANIAVWFYSRLIKEEVDCGDANVNWRGQDASGNDKCYKSQPRVIVTPVVVLQVV